MMQDYLEENRGKGQTTLTKEPDPKRPDIWAMLDARPDMEAKIQTMSSYELKQLDADFTTAVQTWVEVLNQQFKLRGGY